VKLSRLTAPMVQDFRNKLLDAGRSARSASMMKRVVRALSSILADAQDAGLVAQNVVRSLSRKKKRSKAQQRRKLRVGVDIPTPAEVRAIAAVLEG
jgi:integrase